MNDPKLNIHRRNLPHWTADDATYFITFRIIRGQFTKNERHMVIDHIRSGDGRFYRLAAVIVMPDHVHMILRPNAGYNLSRIMKGIKGASARIINLYRQQSGSVWQDESWDRILRDPAEFEEKLNYMAQNPIKAGLVMQLEDYDGWYCNPEWL